MAMERTGVLELLLKRGMDGGVDFLIEALSALVDGIMEAGVSAPGRRRVCRTVA